MSSEHARGTPAREIEDGARRYRGVVCGLGDDGTLQLRDAAGHTIAVVAGDVTVIDGYRKERSDS